MRAKLRTGTEGNPERVAFSDVRRNRRRRSPDLIRESIMATERWLEREAIGDARDGATARPRLQRIELSHE